MRADGDDGPVDLGRSSQQFDADPLARVVSFGAGRDHEQTVGTDERGQHAGSPGQWSGDDLALDPTESDPDPVVHTENGRQLAGEPGGGQRSLPWGGAFEFGQQGDGEDVEGEGGGDREARRAEDRRGPDGSQHDRVSGPDGDAVHGEGPGGGDHPGGVVVPAGTGPGDEDDQVGLLGRVPKRGGDQVGVVRDDVGHRRHAAGLAGLGGEHEGVGVRDLARSELGADGPDLVTGRHDDDCRLPAYLHFGDTRGGAGGRVDGTEPVALRQQELGRADVLADRADVLVRRDRGPDLGAVGEPVHVLAHDHRVVSGRHRVAGVDLCERRVGEHDRPGVRGSDGVLGQDRDPVHGSRVERR